MLRSIVLAAVLLTSAAPAFAQSVTVTVRNLSANTVDRIDAYAVNAAGERGNRSLGNARNIPSKAAEEFSVNTNGCGPVRFVVQLPDKSQFEVNMDLCTDQVLMLQQ